MYIKNEKSNNTLFKIINIGILGISGTIIAVTIQKHFSKNIKDF